jgi:lipid-A-disaccharide synthase-like uncharacterized protein
MGIPVTAEGIWITVGLLGQAAFSARFILQWIYSEKYGKSVIPLGFWYCSIVGGVTLLAYAIYRQDPVFIMGQAFGVVVYSRNLHLIWRERARLKVEAQALHTGVLGEPQR